jgi:hypothetical protein
MDYGRWRNRKAGRIEKVDGTLMVGGILEDGIMWRLDTVPE